MSGIGKVNKSLLDRNEQKGKVTKYNNEESLIVKQLNDFAKNKNLEESIKRPRRVNVFYPSTLGTPCDRALYLDYHGMLPSEDIDGSKQRIFDHGHATESRYFGYFLRMGLFKAREVRVVASDPPISGRADFILTKPSGDYIIVELKTINDNGFENLMEAKDTHYVQLQIYLSILEINDGIVLYENKNNQKLKEFYIKRDEDFWKEKIVERCHRIQNMTEPPEINKDHSKYCSCRMYV